TIHLLFLFFFFFSSRRRHTRWPRDWSSDVCSSDLRIPLVEIRPTRGWTSLRLAEFWDFRELLYFLTWRDLKVRYKQTALGAAWEIGRASCRERVEISVVAVS